MCSSARVLGFLSKSSLVSKSIYPCTCPQHWNYLAAQLHVKRGATSFCNYKWDLGLAGFRINNDEDSAVPGIRRISVYVPLNMGRRSSKIAARKGAQDAKKSKLYGKIGKELVTALKRGGPNPASNSWLADILEKAKELDIPKEILERNIKKASEKGQEAFIEKFYEVYGFGGVGLIVEVLTDNLHRSAQMVRDAVKKGGGKMADPGSILFKFRRARVVNVKEKQVDKDKLLGAALDCGAEDVIEPPMYDDDGGDDQSERYFKVVTTTENYSHVMSKFREEGIPFETDGGFEYLPITTVEPDDEAMDLNQELIAKLLELEDVDAVYSDQK